MIKEFAFGLSNRHHFGDVSETEKWVGMAQDTFMSLWDYDQYVIEYVKKNKTLSAFDGAIYMPDRYILDVDGSNSENARQACIGLTMLLDDIGIPYDVWFSGTGFHIDISGAAFRWKPCDDLHLKVKDTLKNAGIYEYADPSVSDKTRLIRVPYTRNSKSNLWKVPVTIAELNGSIDNILRIAKEKKFRHTTNLDATEPVFDVIKRHKPKQEEKYQPVLLGRNPDPVNYPCIQTMMEGVTQGSRHQIALRIAAHLRWRYPEHYVRLLMEDWRSRVDLASHPFTKEEMDKLVTHTYDGHNGNGDRYGCQDFLKDKFCANTCKLYKAKKGNTLMDAESMEKVLAEFLTNDHKPINIGELYGQNFPIFPGEVVILQAPPKSMKTMLLQNWITSFKKNTYFLEMEMSPRQIWSRFVMIEKNWDEEQLKAHYQQYNNGISEDFKWLTVDYSSCYPQEIQKRIMMLPRKPEILVIDHMGLFRTKKADNNMKVEEVSQALMELAVQHNMIVFAVSEITKSAFHEGMDITSARGSFRIAYNANKVLSLTPYRSKEENIIRGLHLTCTANREREGLDVRLNVNGARITS